MSNKTTMAYIRKQASKQKRAEERRAVKPVKSRPIKDAKSIKRERKIKEARTHALKNSKKLTFEGALQLLGQTTSASVGRDELLRFERECFARNVEARKRDDLSGSAGWSEAQQLFKSKLLTGFCKVCGATVSKGATRCQTHRSKIKARQLLPWMQFEPPTRLGRNGNARKFVPLNDIMAPLGFYATPVRRVVAKWVKDVPMKLIESYFCHIAVAVISERGDLANLKVARPTHWPLVWELGTAISSVMADKTKAEHWLIFDGLGGGSSAGMPVPHSWDEIEKQIVNLGGPSFKLNTLVITAKRLRLI